MSTASCELVRLLQARFSLYFGRYLQRKTGSNQRPKTANYNNNEGAVHENIEANVFYLAPRKQWYSFTLI